jgi:hypothetical protein
MPEPRSRDLAPPGGNPGEDSPGTSGIAAALNQKSEQLCGSQAGGRAGRLIHWREL